MKSVAVIFSLLALSLSANAQSACLGEAQIIAKVDSLNTNSMTFCRVMVKEISFYNESAICPLNVADVLEQGIEIGLKNGHDCEYDSDTISGVVVRTKAGHLILE